MPWKRSDFQDSTPVPPPSLQGRLVFVEAEAQNVGLMKPPRVWMISTKTTWLLWMCIGVCWLPWKKLAAGHWVRHLQPSEPARGKTTITKLRPSRTNRIANHPCCMVCVTVNMWMGLPRPAVALSHSGVSRLRIDASDLLVLGALHRTDTDIPRLTGKLLSALPVTSPMRRQSRNPATPGVYSVLCHWLSWRLRWQSCGQSGQSWQSWQSCWQLEGGLIDLHPSLINSWELEATSARHKWSIRGQTGSAAPPLASSPTGPREPASPSRHGHRKARLSSSTRGGILV